MESIDSISLGNSILFTIALFGAVASFARPLRKPQDPQTQWEPWQFSFLTFFGYLWILILVILFAPVFGDILAEWITPGQADDDQVRSITATLVMQIGLVGTILSAIYRRGWSLGSFFCQKESSWTDTLRQAGHLFFRYLPAIWLVGMIWGGLLYGVGIEPEPQLAAQWIADSDSVPFLLVMGVMVVITAPISEELVFRGFLYRFLRDRGPARLALIFSALLFALLHASLHSFLPLLFIGLLLAKLYEDTRDIRIPILFHLFFNLFSYLNLIFLP
ncbi:MAG: CPBP family intramembrane glutamic endopeptidase [Puniceicoccales bacterium]